MKENKLIPVGKHEATVEIARVSKNYLIVIHSARKMTTFYAASLALAFKKCEEILNGKETGVEHDTDNHCTDSD